MELVYFWLEKFGDKYNQGINFSQNYTFKVEKQGEKYILGMEENSKKIPNNFFGEKISNISCIIGDNGSGKTTLIRQILKLKDYRYLKENNIKYLLIFKRGAFFKYETNVITIEIPFNLLLQNHIDSDFDTRENIKYIYFTNDFNPMPESFITNVFDISIKNKLIHRTLKEGETNITGLDYVETLYNENMEDIAEFIIDYGDKFIKKIPYDNLKEKLTKIKNEGKLIYNVKEQFSRYTEDDIYKEIYNKITIENNKIKSKNFVEKFILNTWIYISDSVYKDIEEKRFSKEAINELIQRKKGESLEKWFEKQLEILEKLTKTYDFNMRKVMGNQEKYYPTLLTVDSDKIELLYKYIKVNQNNNNGNTQLEIFYSDNKKLAKNIKEVNRLKNLLKFRFKDGFSNGEYTLIYLLKEIFHLEKNIDLNGKTKGIVFFIEEIESFLHPEWQRRLIELLKIMANNCPWLGENKVQFILASHTPFLVGDLPIGNIKKISNFEIKDLEQNPFGNNLLNILKSQFQLESLFGEFIREKIKKYVKKLKGNKQLSPEEKEEVKFLINNIEEPLIKNSLKELYEKTFSKEEKIKFLEEEIKKLKEEKDAEVR